MSRNAAEADAADEVDDGCAIPKNRGVGVGRVGIGPGDTGEEREREGRKEGGRRGEWNMMCERVSGYM